MERIMKMKRRWKGLLLFVLLVVVLVGGRLIAGLLLQEAPRVLTPEEETLRAHALELHHDAVVFDGHNDVANRILEFGFDLAMDGDELSDRSTFLYEGGPFTWLPNPPYGENVATDTDLARIREGGLDAQFFSIWVDFSFYDPAVPEQSTQRALDMIEVLQEQVRRYPDDIENAYTAQDVKRIASEGKLAALMGLEGGHAIADDLENLRSSRNSILVYGFDHLAPGSVRPYTRRLVVAVSPARYQAV